VSSRTRTWAIVAAGALAAAAVAAVVAWAGRGDTGTAPAVSGGPREGAPPLALDALLDDPAEAVALQSAAELYQSGRRRAALDAFNRLLETDPESLNAAVGAAFSLWPDGTIEQLRALEEQEPGSGLVQLHLGLALFWEGRELEAQDAWRRAEEGEPDSPAAVRAESLLHPEMPAGRPFFVPAEPLPQNLANLLPLDQLDALRERAEAAETATPWIQYGVALQRAGRPLSARDAFDRAAELEPGNVEALAGAAVVRFDKDDPAEAFSRLGPLSDRFASASVVRFHLGLCLLWLRRLDEAREQLRAAVEDGEGTVWAREAADLLARLDDTGASTG
jgi:tetratricopeptide (TPR) repeat protein